MRCNSFSSSDVLLLRRRHPSSNSQQQEGSEQSISSYRLYSRFKDKISQVFYKHGLLCASHPWRVMVMSILLFLVACYPILGTHLMHPSSSQSFFTPTNQVAFKDGRFVFESFKSHVPSSSSESTFVHPSSSFTPPWVSKFIISLDFVLINKEWC